MIKYRVQSYSLDVKPVRVTRETEHTIWIQNKNNLGGNSCVIKRRKNSHFDKTFDTFDEAKLHIIERTNKALLMHDSRRKKYVDDCTRAKLIVKVELNENN